MNFNCNCFGLATAARVPVKRYNFLVPDIYPIVQPPFGKDLGVPIERKFKKLAEYLERNEHRVPKVSRRLARRLYRDVKRQRLGYCKLTVEAYKYLLREHQPEKSALFANELVVGSVEKSRYIFRLCQGRQPAGNSMMGSVVGRLLRHSSVDLRLLGVDLLTEFTRQQGSSDYVAQLEGFVPLLCRDANPRLPFSGAKGDSTQESLPLLRAGCLRALLEHLRYCARVSYVSHHLDSLTYVVLDNIEEAGMAAEPSDLAEARAAAEAGSERSPHALRQLSIGARVGASPPDIAALLVFEQLSQITRDAAEGKKVLDFIMRYLDQGSRWLGSPVLQTSVTVLRQAAQAEHQHFILYSRLIRHVAAAQLAPAQRVAVLGLAVEEALRLHPGLALSALVLALKELPPVLAGTAATAPASSTDVQPLAGGGRAAVVIGQEIELATLPASRADGVGPGEVQREMAAGLRQLAGRVKSSIELLEVVSTSVCQLRSPEPASTAALQCASAVAEVVQQVASKADTSPQLAPGRPFPRELLRHLASIMANWEAAQRLLAHRLLLQLLPVHGGVLDQEQAHVLLSALWQEAGIPGSQPACFVAMDRSLRAAVDASPQPSVFEAFHMVACLQAALADSSSGHLAGVSAARAVALLAVCTSALQRISQMLQQPGLLQLPVVGWEGALTCLQPGPSGLHLTGPVAAANGGSAEGISLTSAAGTFTAKEDSEAARFIATWRASSSQADQLARFAQALPPSQYAPAHAPQSAVARDDIAFKPWPPEDLAPGMRAAGAYKGGPAAARSSHESKLAQRVKELFQTLNPTQEADGAAVAATSKQQTSAAIQADVVSLQADGNGQAAVFKTVDEVLAEVDAALGKA